MFATGSGFAPTTNRRQCQGFLVAVVRQKGDKSKSSMFRFCLVVVWVLLLAFGSKGTACGLVLKSLVDHGLFIAQKQYCITPYEA